MNPLRISISSPLRFGAVLCAFAVILAACAVGPDHVTPETAAPDDWSTWRSADESLRVPVLVGEKLPPDWWHAFNDPVLDRLQQRAIEASPDLLTAALHYAQARTQLTGAASAQLPQVSLTGSVNR